MVCISFKPAANMLQVLGAYLTFITLKHTTTVGFVQLYTSFCSVQEVKRFVLYDLYVDASVRNSGTGALLIKRAAEYAKQQGAARLDLQTETSNKVGQHLYEKLGYQKANQDLYDYSLQI